MSKNFFLDIKVALSWSLTRDLTELCKKVFGVTLFELELNINIH